MIKKLKKYDIVVCHCHVILLRSAKRLCSWDCSNKKSPIKINLFNLQKKISFVRIVACHVTIAGKVWFHGMIHDKNPQLSLNNNRESYCVRIVACHVTIAGKGGGGFERSSVFSQLTSPDLNNKQSIL